jgi:hypothetical protein
MLGKRKGFWKKTKDVWIRWLVEPSGWRTKKPCTSKARGGAESQAGGRLARSNPSDLSPCPTQGIRPPAQKSPFPSSPPHEPGHPPPPSAAMGAQQSVNAGKGRCPSSYPRRPPWLRWRGCLWLLNCRLRRSRVCGNAAAKVDVHVDLTHMLCEALLLPPLRCSLFCLPRSPARFLLILGPHARTCWFLGFLFFQ